MQPGAKHMKYQNKTFNFWLDLTYRPVHSNMSPQCPNMGEFIQEFKEIFLVDHLFVVTKLLGNNSLSM